MNLPNILQLELYFLSYNSEKNRLSFYHISNRLVILSGGDCRSLKTNTKEARDNNCSHRTLAIFKKSPSRVQCRYATKIIFCSEEIMEAIPQIFFSLNLKLWCATFFQNWLANLKQSSKPQQLLCRIRWRIRKRYSRNSSDPRKGLKRIQEGAKCHYDFQNVLVRVPEWFKKRIE